MEISQRKEYFSDGYIQAVAAVAGVMAEKRRQDFDKIDWEFGLERSNGTKSPRLEAQAKCTASDRGNAAYLSYVLDVPTYDALRGPSILPRILIVCVVPRDVGEWLEQTPEQLVMKRCALYVSLREHPATPNHRTVTVHLPRTQILTPQALMTLLQIADAGGDI